MAINNQLDVDIQEVFSNIGYGSDYEPATRILSLVDEYVENVHQLIEPSYSCVIRDIEWVQGSVTFVEGLTILESQVIARLLEQCQKAAVFLVTIGSHLEEMVHRLSKGGLVLQATVLDAVGSVVVEKVADFVQSRVGEVARTQGLAISRRFSPGYCDWDIGQQKAVFRAVNGNSLGVCLTEGCLMLPRKSISGIIGIGPRDIENYNPCTSCDRHDCVGRR